MGMYMYNNNSISKLVWKNSTGIYPEKVHKQPTVYKNETNVFNHSEIQRNPKSLLGQLLF